MPAGWRPQPPDPAPAAAPADEYIVDYYDYVPGRPGPEAFRTPRLCKGVKPVLAQDGTRSAHSLRMRSLAPRVAYGEAAAAAGARPACRWGCCRRALRLPHGTDGGPQPCHSQLPPPPLAPSAPPPARCALLRAWRPYYSPFFPHPQRACPNTPAAGDAAYDSFLAAHGAGRALRSLGEYAMRAELFRSNAALIAAHNAANRSYTLRMNRFGDWTRVSAGSAAAVQGWGGVRVRRTVARPWQAVGRATLGPACILLSRPRPPPCTGALTPR